MRIVIRDEAADDIEEIFEWIANDSRSAAIAMVRRIRARIHSILLPELVHTGRPGRAEGTRELIEAPYIIVYDVDDQREIVTVLAVMHGARDR